MSVDLYYMPMSSPCRAVLLTAEAIGITLNLIEINLFEGEHLKPEFEQEITYLYWYISMELIHNIKKYVLYVQLAIDCDSMSNVVNIKPQKLNPQKTIPFLVDGDYKLSESRAIMSYLVDQYGKNIRLNPQTPAGRALVNHRLHFDIGTLYRGMKNYYYPVVFRGANYNPEYYKVLEGAFDVLDKFLNGQDYVAGRNLTIADLALAATVSTSEVFGFEVEKYVNVAKWMDRIKSSAPGYRKANGEGLEIMKRLADNAKKE